MKQINKLPPQQLEMLEQEQSRGRRAQMAYDHFIKDFVEQKRQVLFDTWRSISSQDEQALAEIKKMQIAVDALDTEIQTIIQTGQMASQTLEEHEERH